MEKILKHPKIVIYENVDKIVSILEPYINDYEGILEDLAMKILDKFNISYGRKTEINPFQDNVQVILEDNKVIIKTKST